MVAETANGCLVLHNARTIAERHNRAPNNLKTLLYALLLSASGELLPLDEDLSWMSATPALPDYGRIARHTTTAASDGKTRTRTNQKRATNRLRFVPVCGNMQPGGGV